MNRWFLSAVTTTVLFGASPIGIADEKPKKDPPKITVAADKTPFQKEINFAEGDCSIVVLPNGKEVALWVEKDRFPVGEQKTKSGLQCMWGEKPFKLETKTESYIEQGSVITTVDKTTEHELFIGDWQLSYINDLMSTPQLKVTVIVKQRDKKKEK
jgi:hypothetical protein